MDIISVLLGLIIGLTSLAYLFGVTIFFSLSYLETRAPWDYHPKIAMLGKQVFFLWSLC